MYNQENISNYQEKKHITYKVTYKILKLRYTEEIKEKDIHTKTGIYGLLN